MKRTIESLQESEAVHCPTLSSAIEFCNLLHKAGKRWKGGEPYIRNCNWEKFKQDTCYSANGEFGPLIWVQAQGNKIIHVHEFLESDSSKLSLKRIITHQQAQQIIDSACELWQKKLANKWAFSMALKKAIQISDEFYIEMRRSCTPKQHKLFDKIFGPDKSEFTSNMLKPGEAMVVEDKSSEYDGELIIRLKNTSIFVSLTSFEWITISIEQNVLGKKVNLDLQWQEI